MITIISGLGRCGSSLVMQMLLAGGMKPTGKAHHAYWEDGRTATLPGDSEWVSQIAPGSVLKCLNPAVKPLPHGPDYRWIWIDRNRKAQRKSWDKFVAEAQKKQPSMIVERKDLDFDTDRRNSLELIKSLGGPVLRLRFEDLLAKPKAAAVRINQFVGGGLDVANMCRCVVKRPPSCLPYMLEDGWVATGDH